MRNKSKIFILLSGMILIAASLACNLFSHPLRNQPVSATVSATAVVIEPTAFITSPIEVPTAVSVPAGLEVADMGTQFSIPTGLATGAQPQDVPESTESMIYPAHNKFILSDYPLQGKTFEPEVLIIPFKEFESKDAATGAVLADLKNILDAGSLAADQSLPFLPNQHASMVFHSQEKFLSFKNGKGIRYVSQLDQAPMPVNNTEMFYTFQGISSDGELFVSVILLVNLDFLPADHSMNGTTPDGGIPFDWVNFDKFPDYLIAIKARLNHPDLPFTPSLESLDTLVESLLVGRW